MFGTKRNDILLAAGAAAAFAATTFTATSLRAAPLLLSESFNYPVGDLGPASPANDGGTGWETGGWNITSGTGQNVANADVAAGSLSYGTLLTSGNRASLDTVSNNTNLFRDPTAALGGAGSDLWFSVLVNAAGASSGLSLFNTGAELSFIGAVSTLGYGVRYKTGAIVGPADVNQIFSPTVATNTGTHLIVLHLDQTGTPIYTAWLDPDVSSLGIGAAPTGGSMTTQTATTTAFSFNRLRLGEFDSAGSSLPAAFDELRIGTSWQDVSPTVPEPGSAAVMLAGAGLCSVGRRRRRGGLSAR